MRATAHDLVCRCMRKRSAHGEPDSIHHAPRRSGPVFDSCVETAESALNLRYTRDAQTVDAYIQLRVFTDPSAPLEPHPDSEARLGSLLVRIAQQVFKWTATDIGGKLRIFQRDDERIAFNRDGLLFFNAHYYRTLHMGTAAAAGPKTGADAAAAGDAECFWFVTFAHELAHNVSPGHDLAHEQALEALTTA
mmetsp:Transcript_16086/g.49163  ORF Transcript_16086/g.49163 Transcript_16086/m.49163 type:complete len:192 (+) Transcript_16086:2556-3131(+)